ncbi:MAG: DUF1186 domain-containing protein [Planctomycetaceae bacterium]
MNSDIRLDDESPLDLAQILNELDNEDCILPYDAIRAAQKHREQMTPLLIEMLRQATEWVRQGNDAETNGHLIALFLLIEFKAKEAYPAIIDSFSLTDLQAMDLYGDALLDFMPGLLAQLAHDDLTVIDDIIANPAFGSFRCDAPDVYLYLVRDGVLSREEAIERLRRHLRRAIDERDDIVSILIAALDSLSPAEICPEIDEAFHLNLLDESYISREEIEENIARGDVHFQENLNWLPTTGVVDTFESLQDCYLFDDVGDEFDEEPDDDYDEVDPEYEALWNQVFRPDEPVHPGEPRDDLLTPTFHESTIVNFTPKVGRNEPCPCGSGKKYKKCCGAS